MEFIFEDFIYKYKNGCIYYKDKYGYFQKLCPVLPSLDGVLDMLSDGQRIEVLENIVHSCCYGYSDGKKAKVAEIKRIFDID